MQTHHFILFAIIAVAFYLVGAKFPGLAAKVGI